MNKVKRIIELRSGRPYSYNRGEMAFYLSCFFDRRKVAEKMGVTQQAVSTMRNQYAKKIGKKLTHYGGDLTLDGKMEKQKLVEKYKDAKFI
jgi:hypothetical protein